MCAWLGFYSLPLSDPKWAGPQLNPALIKSSESLINTSTDEGSRVLYKPRHGSSAATSFRFSARSSPGSIWHSAAHFSGWWALAAAAAAAVDGNENDDQGFSGWGRGLPRRPERCVPDERVRAGTNGLRPLIFSPVARRLAARTGTASPKRSVVRRADVVANLHRPKLPNSTVYLSVVWRCGRAIKPRFNNNQLWPTSVDRWWCPTSCRTDGRTRDGRRSNWRRRLLRAINLMTLGKCPHRTDNTRLANIPSSSNYLLQMCRLSRVCSAGTWSGRVLIVTINSV